MTGRSLRRFGAVVAGSAVAAACSASTSSDGGDALPVPEVGPTTTSIATVVTTSTATSAVSSTSAPPAVSEEAPSVPDDGSGSNVVSSDPDPSPDPTTPETPDAAPTSTPDGDPQPPPATVAPTSGIAVTYGGGRSDSIWTPLGWWDGTAWREDTYTIDGTWIGPPEPTVGSLSATSLDLPDGPAQVLGGLVAGPNEFFCAGDETGPTIDLGLELPDTPLSIGYDAVAVTADWPLQPRPVRQIGAAVPVYAEVGASLMADLVDTAAEGEVVQVVRVDLDADGDEEVLVSYERQQRPQFGGAGDFASVYVRVPAADGTVDDRLVSSYVSRDPEELESPFPTPGRVTVVAVADLNGDGVMEVALRDLFWEYGGISVYAFADGRLDLVMSGGCGV